MIRRHYNFSLTLALFLLFAFAPSVLADDYISVGYVNTNYNVQPPDSFVFSDNANGYEVTIGHQLPLPWLSVELSLADNGTSSRTVGPLNYELDSESIAVLLHGAWPIATIA